MTPTNAPNAPKMPPRSPHSAYATPSHAFSPVPRDRAPLWVEITAIPIGGLIAGFFGWCLYYEMRSPPTHTAHIAIFSSGVLLGLLVGFGRWFLFPVFQRVVVLYADYRRGGRRWYEQREQRERPTTDEFIRPEDEGQS